MTEKTDDERRGRGRPPLEKDYDVRFTARITEEQRAHLMERYGSLIGGIRKLIDRDMGREDD